MNRIFLFLALLLLLSNCTDPAQQAIETLPEADQELLSAQQYQTWQSGQFYVHYPSDSYTASQLQDLGTQLNSALQNVLRTVDIPAYEEVVHFIIFADQASMSAYLGDDRWYATRPAAHLAYLVHNEDRAPYFSRSLFQLVATDTWGPTTSELLSAGGALFSKGICQDITYFLDEVGASLYRNEQYLSFRNLFRDFETAREQSPVLAEIQAAVFYQFVHDNFGPKRVAKLWKAGMPRMEGIIYLSPFEVEKEILGRWRNYTPTMEVDWSEIQLKGC